MERPCQSLGNIAWIEYCSGSLPSLESIQAIPNSSTKTRIGRRKSNPKSDSTVNVKRYWRLMMTPLQRFANNSLRDQQSYTTFKALAIEPELQKGLYYQRPAPLSVFLEDFIDMLWKELAFDLWFNH